MREYNREQVLTLLGSAFEAAEQNIYKGLRGADNSDRLDSLDTLDALDLAHTQVRAILDNQLMVETTNE